MLKLKQKNNVDSVQMLAGLVVTAALLAGALWLRRRSTDS